MNRILYYIIVTLVFGILSVPEIISISMKESFLIPHINRALLKTILIFFIAIIEVLSISKRNVKISGTLLICLLLIWIFFKIQHWPYGREIDLLIGIASVLFVILISVDFIATKKQAIHYLLIAFLIQRIAIILLTPNEILWWTDVIICTAIFLVGIGTLWNSRSILKVKNEERR